MQTSNSSAVMPAYQETTRSGEVGREYEVMQKNVESLKQQIVELESAIRKVQRLHSPNPSVFRWLRIFTV